MEEANKLIGAGKKHLVMGKVVEAVSALQEACDMLAKKYGDTADECGEAFFWCGKALLDLARMENSVLGNALEGVPEEEDEEKTKDSNIDSTENIDEKTRDELRLQVYDAMAEKKDEEKKNKDSVKVEGKQSEDEEKSDDVEKEKAEAGDDQQNAVKEGDEEKKSGMNGKPESEEKTENDEEAEKESGDKEEEEAEDGEDEDGEDEDGEDVEMESDADEEGEGDNAAEKDSDDEVGNLQLAWEMLEVAKVIYKRKDTKEEQLMAAQAHLKLGEVSAESGNYAQALEDFRECLKLQVKHLEPDSRLLAETHYQLGLTYSLNLQYSHAIDELQSSISVIKSRLAKLQELLDKAEDPEALPEERKEMEELKALLPEIQEKVEDATEGLKTASTAAEGVKGVLDGGSSSSASTGSTVENGGPSTKINDTPANGLSSTNGDASTAAVSDISHLVRKKRKPEESPVKEGGVKKVKTDAGETNGVHEPQTDAHKANGDANGHT